MQSVVKSLSIGAMVLCFAPLAVAQSLTNQPDPLKFVVAPDVPGPGEEVIIEVQGVGNFLNDSTITWQVDGKTVASGVGERTFNVTLGALGTRTSVRVVVDSPTRGVITKNFTFLPSVVHMLWEAETSVPPWFKSKALYSAGSPLMVMALPQIILSGQTISANNLTFEWKRNGTPLPAQSGKGKNTIKFVGNQLLPRENIEVDVFAGDALAGRGSVTITAQPPEVLLYVRDPLRGVLYDSALVGAVNLAATEFAAKAEPFYFTKTSVRDGLVPFEWRINGQKTSGPETTEGALTLRQTGSGAGRASLEVSLQNTDTERYVQSAKTAIQILFGGATESAFTNFFGI